MLGHVLADLVDARAMTINFSRVNNKSERCAFQEDEKLRTEKLKDEENVVAG